MILGIKYFGTPWGLYELDKESQLAVIGAHNASMTPPAEEAPTVRRRAPASKKGRPLSAAVPDTVTADPDAWEAFRKFHDSVG